MKIDNNTGAWLNDTLEGHDCDQALSEAIIKFLKHNKVVSVYDFGCGHGQYTKNILNSGINCIGYDGNPNTPELTNGTCGVLDLSKKFELDKKQEYVLCLEVGEHIPEQFESTLIDNIHRHNTRGIILSWAVIGQGGDGHVNCKNNNYIKNIFENLGYANDLEDEYFLRLNSSLPWFKNTIMVFKKIQENNNG